MADQIANKVAADHDELLKAFTDACIEKNLLSRPESLGSRDLYDGLLDPPTLLYAIAQLRLPPEPLDHPADPTRRFLTARKFDPGEATKHFEAAHRFREDNHITRLYDLIEIADFEQTRKLYFHWTGRRDKKGLPLCFYDLDHMDKSALAHWEKTRTIAQWQYSQAETKPPNPDMRQLASVYIDSLLRFVIPLCSMMTDRPDPSIPITSSIYLVDASNFGLKQAWSVKIFAQEISWMLNTCYPETIENIYSIWKFLKSYVDPHTSDKIVFLLHAEVLPTLREHIDDANIPAKFGGGLAFTHGQLPDLESDIQQHLGLEDPPKSLPPGPIKWIEELDGRKTALAVGSQSGAERSDRVAIIDMSVSNNSAQALSVEA